MTPSDAVRAAGWQVDALTADGAPERAISPARSGLDDDIAAATAGIPLGAWCPP